MAASHGSKALGQRKEVAAVVLQASVPVEAEDLEIVEETVRPDPYRLRAERLRGLDDVPIDVLVERFRRLAKRRIAELADRVAVTAKVRVERSLVPGHFDAGMRAKERGPQTSIIEQP